jgi:hypothetical protein
VDVAPTAWIALSVVLTGSAQPGRESAASRPVASSPTTAAAADRIVIYKPGVAINWTRRQVELSGRIALREGMLELFACAHGADGSAKTHESIVLLEGRPLHIFQALGLIGLQPGHPPQWDPSTNKVIPATGQRLELRVEWLDDGRPRQADVSEWMQPGNEPNKPLGPLPWVFAGSQARPDGSILADEDGTVATVVDFDGSIISLAAAHSSSDAELWVAARPGSVPQLNAPVTLIVRAAGLWIEMDRFGRTSVEGKRLSGDELVEEVRRYLKASPGGIVRVLVAPTASESDVQILRNQLRSGGAPKDAIQVERRPDSAFPANDPEAGKALLRNQLHLQQSVLESARKGQARLVERLGEHRAALERRTAALADYVAWLEQALAYLSGESASQPASAPNRRTLQRQTTAPIPDASP